MAKCRGGNSLRNGTGRSRQYFLRDGAVVCFFLAGTGRLFFSFEAGRGGLFFVVVAFFQRRDRAIVFFIIC